MLPLLSTLHLLATAIWTGGIFFAYLALRPASMLLEPPMRLALWARTFERYFPWVWGFVLTLLFTGPARIQAGALELLAMTAIGWLMCGLFAYLYFSPYQALRQAVVRGDTPAAAAAMARIRPVMATNLSLGLIVSALGLFSAGGA